MKKTYPLLALCLVTLSAGAKDAGKVEFRECPKCDKRIRIALDEGKAYVNLSRLEGADKEAVARRAAALLAEATITPALDPKIRPLMGWSSWNTFAVNISEEIILDTARAMATNGLKAAGYTYVNIDDGFFNGHADGGKGKLQIHPTRFPNGLKPVADGIHALGLKAGIYSDAGADTCGSGWNGDKGGIGAGLYQHDADDCAYYFTECGFDFIKVDYCGGQWLKLDEKKRYTEIAAAIKATGRDDVRLNICRWAYPGTWVADIAESWRTTGDIRANWSSVRRLIKENLYLSAFACPGHYNDLDMLEVGHRVGQVKTEFGKSDTGLTAEEEHTHFGMWCMLSSPLLIGCDARTIPADTMALITNPYLLAMNQNDLGVQAYVVAHDGDTYVLVKDAKERFGTSRYVALYNPGGKERAITVRAADLDLAGTIAAVDLTKMADMGTFKNEVTVKVPAHGAKFYRFDAERRVMRTVYEAETAFLPDYQELVPGPEAGTAHAAEVEGASGGVAVMYLGNRATNGIAWRDVAVDSRGIKGLVVRCRTFGERAFTVSVDGKARKTVTVPAANGWQDVTVDVPLAPGRHEIRLDNASGWMPDIDRMTLVR